MPLQLHNSVSNATIKSGHSHLGGMNTPNGFMVLPDTASMSNQTTWL